MSMKDIRQEISDAKQKNLKLQEETARNTARSDAILQYMEDHHTPRTRVTFHPNGNYTLHLPKSSEPELEKSDYLLIASGVLVLATSLYGAVRISHWAWTHFLAFITG